MFNQQYLNSLSDEAMADLLYAMHKEIINRAVNEHLNVSLEDAADELRRASRASVLDQQSYLCEVAG